jgi:hypothetical protein
MLERAPSPAAVRARRARRRRRDGLVPRTVEVDECGLCEMLIASGRLTEAQALGLRVLALGDLGQHGLGFRSRLPGAKQVGAA